MLTKYKVLTLVQLRYLEGKNRLHLTLASPDWISNFEHFSRAHLSQGCLGFGDFSEISEIRPTLTSCISELKEYFFKISNFLKRSMSKLSFKPNNIKNGHLAPKLQPIQNPKFSKIGIHSTTICYTCFYQSTYPSRKQD